MKPQYYIIGLILVIFSLPQTLSAQKAQEQITGTWVFDYEASKSKMETKAKQHYDKMNNTRKDKLEKAYKGRKLFFAADGSCIQQLADGRTISGTWGLSKKENSITITYPNGKQQIYKIKSLAFTALVLKSENSGKAKMIMSELHFTKN